MNLKRMIFPVALSACVAGALTWTTVSAADTTTVEPASQPVAERTTYHPPPNPWLIGGGMVAFAGSYVPAVIVAGETSNSYDTHLAIPVVGPWLDLADRPSGDAGFRALLILSGVFQAGGVLATVLGFVTPGPQTVVKTADAHKPTLQVLPAQVSRDGYGVAAFGNF
jgi:hypothetical protein